MTGMSECVFATTNTLAMIAAGAMGSAIAEWRACANLLKGRSQATVGPVQQAGMISASDDGIVAHAQFVLSVVPPGEVLALAERLRLFSNGRAAGPSSWTVTR
jgi:hypothetical protein